MLHHPVLETKNQQQQRQNNMSNTSATKFNSTGLKTTHHRTYSSNPFHSAVPNQESQLTLMANCYNTAGSGGNQEGTKAKSPRKRKYKRRRNKHYLKQ